MRDPVAGRGTHLGGGLRGGQVYRIAPLIHDHGLPDWSIGWGTVSATSGMILWLVSCRRNPQDRVPARVRGSCQVWEDVAPVPRVTVVRSVARVVRDGVQEVPVQCGGEVPAGDGEQVPLQLGVHGIHEEVHAVDIDGHHPDVHGQVGVTVRSPYVRETPLPAGWGG